MQPRYRADYPGEFVVLESTWSAGKRSQKREWIENPISNQHISGRAACIISAVDTEQFNYTILQRHRGGLLGTLKLQTYGTGAIAETMRLDFAVEDQKEQLQKLVDNKYHEDNVVYTTARNCIAYPGDFYLIPQAPHLRLPALPIYLAAFDGHKEVFLIGYTNDTVYENPHWQSQVLDVLSSYTTTKFWIVGQPSNIPELWLDCPNVNTMSYPDFIGYADC